MTVDQLIVSIGKGPEKIQTHESMLLKLGEKVHFIAKKIRKGRRNTESHENHK